MSSEAISDKRGLGLGSNFINRFGRTLIEAPADLIRATLVTEFQAKCETVFVNQPNQFVVRKKLSPDFRANHESDDFPPLLGEFASYLWQHPGHSWSELAWASDEIAMLLALFLETRTVVLTYSGVSGWTTLKTFYEDQWIEYYEFGDDFDHDPTEKLGDRGWGHSFWDLEVVYDDLERSSCWQSRHFFSSSARDVTESQVLSILDTGEYEFGFLDATLKSYGVYVSDYHETPYHGERRGFEHWQDRLIFQRIEAVAFPEDDDYWFNLPSIPKRVSGK